MTVCNAHNKTTKLQTNIHIIGRISTKELGTVMRELGQNPTHQELLDMIHDVDINNDGYIDFPEFLVLMSRAAPKQNDDDEIRAAFNVFDMDGSGTISKDELRYVLRGLGENLSEKDLDEMFNQADLGKYFQKAIITGHY